MATLRQKKLARNLLANKGSMAQAMREAGYSETYARNPQLATNSESVKKLFEQIGVSQTVLAQNTKQLMSMKDSLVKVFKHGRKIVHVVIDEDDPKYNKVIGGKQTKEEYRYVPISRQKINKFLKTVSGELIDISTDESSTTVEYAVPERVMKFKAVELGHKIFGNFAPEKHEHEVTHNLTEEDKKAIDDVFEEQSK